MVVMELSGNLGMNPGVWCAHPARIEAHFACCYPASPVLLRRG